MLQPDEPERRTGSDSGELEPLDWYGEIPDFDVAPAWVRTFYWMPLLGALARRWIESHGAYRQSGPPSPGRGDDERGVREPRRPRPFAGAGAVEMEEPFDDEDDDWLHDGYVVVGREEPGAPTTAA
jgi:hypothetical protein